MSFVELRDVCLCEWLCVFSSVEYKNKHLMRHNQYCDLFLFLAALEET